MSGEHKFKTAILKWMLAAEMSLPVQVHVGPKLLTPFTFLKPGLWESRA